MSAALAGCARKIEFEQVRSIPGRIEISFEVPKGWGRYLNSAGAAKDSWAVEVLHPQNCLVRIDIEKFTTDPGRKGYPVQTSAGLLARIRALPKTQVSAVEHFETKHLKMSRFTDSGNYIETSGGAGKAPRMKDANAFFERNGFLYVISFSSPESEYAIFLPRFEHLLETLELNPG